MFAALGSTSGDAVAGRGATAGGPATCPRRAALLARSLPVIQFVPRVSVRFLVVEFSESFADLWSQIGKDLGIAVEVTSAVEAEPVHADVVAVVLAAAGAEREALEWLTARHAQSGRPVLAVGGDDSRRIALLFVSRGAADYFALPEDAELLRNALEVAVGRFREGRARLVQVGEPDLAAFRGIVGESLALKAVLSRAARLLPHRDATVLLVGETGTGKELLARAIHEGGPRRGAPFVAVNCSALPAHLMESELFGHERGAFTDAHAAKPGLFEVADGGTLFLDEVATLALDLQAKLLRVLEDKEIRRLGGTKSRTVDIRVIAATNRDLREQVAQGAFREDLYYRLRVVRLALPPLRERGQDVLLIAEHVLAALARRHGLPVPSLVPAACRALSGHRWPGNVRELRNAIERVLLLSPPGTLQLNELELVESTPPSSAPTSSPGLVLPYPASLADIVRSVVQQTLDACGGNRTEAAQKLGISRPRLRRLLRERLPS